MSFPQETTEISRFRVRLFLLRNDGLEANKNLGNVGCPTSKQILKSLNCITFSEGSVRRVHNLKLIMKKSPKANQVDTISGGSKHLHHILDSDVLIYCLECLMFFHFS